MNFYGKKGSSKKIPTSYNQQLVLTISYQHIDLGTGKWTSKGFYLLKGSSIKKKYEGKSNQGVESVIKKLLENDALVDDGTTDEYYVLKNDIGLHSPSTAARLVHGNDRNGLIHWMHEGKTLGYLLNEST
jgi:hypothetical protein